MSRIAARRVSTSFAWTFAGRALSSVSQWLVVVLVARLGGPTDVGLLALALAIVNPIMAFTQLSLRPLIATAGREDHPPSRYLTLRAVCTAAGMIVCVSAAAVTGLEAAAVVLVAIVTAGKAVDNLSDVLYGFQQRAEKHELMGVSLVLRSFASLGVVALGYAVTGSLAVAMLLQFVASGLVLAGYDFPRTQGLVRTTASPVLRLSWDPKSWRSIVRVGLPLGVAALLASIVFNGPRLFIDHWLGRAELGRYAALAYLVTAMSLVANSIAQAAAPKLGESVGLRDAPMFFQWLRRLRNIALITGITGVAVAFLFGRALLEFAYGPAFVADSALLAWVMVAGALTFATTFTSYGLIALRWSRTLQWSLVAATGIVLLGCWILVPRFGMGGAVCAWNCGLATQYVMAELRLRRWNAA